MPKETRKSRLRCPEREWEEGRPFSVGDLIIGV